jgi:hypothetical protein
MNQQVQNTGRAALREGTPKGFANYVTANDCCLGAVLCGISGRHLSWEPSLP